MTSKNSKKIQSKFKKFHQLDFLKPYLVEVFTQSLKKPADKIKVCQKKNVSTFSPDHTLIKIRLEITRGGKKVKKDFFIFVGFDDNKKKQAKILDALKSIDQKNGLYFEHPRFVYYDCDRDVLIYESLVGSSLRPELKKSPPLSDERVRNLFASLGKRLSSFHSLSEKDFDFLKEYNIEEETDQIFKDVEDLLREDEKRTINKSREKVRKTKLKKESLTHGDFTPSNILLTKTGLGLIDFDMASISDPALDVACFLVQLKDLVFWEHLPEKKAEQIFATILESYPDQGQDFEKRLDKAKLKYLLNLLKFNLTAPHRVNRGIKEANKKILNLISKI